MSKQNIQIREFRTADKLALILCIAALQHHERLIEPNRIDSSNFAQEYIEKFLAKFDFNQGQIFIAVVNEASAGFVSILTDELLDSELNIPIPIAYVVDLIVLPQFRRRGIAKMLMDKAEQFAQSHGATAVKLEVLAQNKLACDFYCSQGYTEYEKVFLKPLAR